MPSPSDAVAAGLTAIDALVRDDGLLDGVSHAVVGCSGGGDSVALVGILCELRPALRLTLVHCDHRARPESASDVEFVQLLASESDLECRVVRFDPLSPTASGSREAHWRKQRRAAFREVLEATGADVVAVGHTLDDQAETVLLNLARGTGVDGLAGMRSYVEHDGMTIVRPLLGTRRSTLRRYARLRGLEWRRDPSNDDLEFGRNRVRAAVLPQLETVAPGATSNIARLAAIASEHVDFIEHEVNRMWSGLAESQADGSLLLHVPGLRELQRPLAVAVLRRAIVAVHGDLKGFGKRHFDGVLDGVLDGEPAALDLPGVRVRLENDTLLLQRLQNRRVAPSRGQEAS